MLPKPALLVLSLLSMIFVSGCGGGGGSDSNDATPVDRTAPVITVNGPLTVSHEQGTAYTCLLYTSDAADDWLVVWL